MLTADGEHVAGCVDVKGLPNVLEDFRRVGLKLEGVSQRVRRGVEAVFAGAFFGEDETVDMLEVAGTELFCAQRVRGGLVLPANLREKFQWKSKSI